MPIGIRERIRSLIFLPDLIFGLPGFADLAEDDRVCYPKTDGSSVYWRDGLRPLSVAEIRELAGRGRMGNI